MKLIWITWEVQVRNRSMARELDAELVEVCIKGGRLKRYIGSSLVTLKVLRRARGMCVFVQCPSVVLAVLALVVRPILRPASLVVDAHNAVFESPRLLALVMRWVVRSADLVLVSNGELVGEVEAGGGRAFVMPDPIPKIVRPIAGGLEPLLDPATRSVLFICSWASDEPVEEVFSAAALLGEDFHIYVTGKVKPPRLPTKIPKNVTFLGFLPEIEYERCLFEAKVILDLTTRESCLVCGAYESVSVGRPMLLSDTTAIRSYFTKGVVYVSNSAESICSGVKTIFSAYEMYTEAVAALKNELELSWLIRNKKLVEYLNKERVKAPL